MMDAIGSMLELITEEPGDELARLLYELRWLVLKHPIAAQSIVRALLAEGRAFGATEAGMQWRKRLAHSELVRRGAAIFELGTLGMLDGGDQPLPTQLIDAFARAASRRDLEEALARRLEPDAVALAEVDG